MSETWDVIIAGGGPAGLQAALMLGRARRRVVVLDAGMPRNRFAAHMHGVLGNEGIAPEDFLSRARRELDEYGIEVRSTRVERVDEVDGGLRVTANARPGTSIDSDSDSDSEEILFARQFIVATGLTDKLPDIPGLVERWGTSVLHCPYCHGWEVRGRRLGVLAPSSESLMHAQLIRQWSDHVVVFTGQSEVTAASRKRLRSRGVEVVTAPIERVLGAGTTICEVQTREGDVVALDALFVAPSAIANDSFLDHLDLAKVKTPQGIFLETDERDKPVRPEYGRWATRPARRRTYPCPSEPARSPAHP